MAHEDRSIGWHICRCKKWYNPRSGKALGPLDQETLGKMSRGVAGTSSKPCRTCDPCFWAKKKSDLFERYERMLKNRCKTNEGGKRK